MAAYPWDMPRIEPSTPQPKQPEREPSRTDGIEVAQRWSYPSFFRAEEEREIPRYQHDKVLAQQFAEQHVAEGLALIRAGLSEAALTHFESPTAAAKAGILMDVTFHTSLKELPSDQNSLKELIALMARRAWNHDGIRIAHASYLLNRNVDVSSASSEELRNMAILHYEMALIHAEEWLHVLQHYKGGGISTHLGPVPQVYAREIDIAAYMQECGVVLSEYFLARYERKRWLEAYENIVDYSRFIETSLAANGSRPLLVGRQHEVPTMTAVARGVSRHQLIIQIEGDGFLIQNGKAGIKNNYFRMPGQGWQLLENPIRVPAGTEVMFASFGKCTLKFCR